jgi:Fe-S cluster biogenesis protein NfuA
VVAERPFEREITASAPRNLKPHELVQQVVEQQLRPRLSAIAGAIASAAAAAAPAAAASACATCAAADEAAARTISRLVQECWAQDPERRPPMAAVVQSLRSALEVWQVGAGVA